MKLNRKNVRSTQQSAIDPPLGSKKIFFKALEPKDLLTTDLIGRFPVLSSRGYKYVCICYIYDADAILFHPMKSRSEAKHICVYLDIFDYLEKRGLRPEHHTMDNKYSAGLKTLIMDTNKNKLQLVPPHDHHNNPAEKKLTHSSVILFQVYVQWTPFSLFTYGADYYHSVKQPSMYYALHASTLTCQPSTI